MSGATVLAMSEQLRHRGPDETSHLVLAGGRLGLGHTRLSIIDLAHSHQPMQTPDGRHTVVFNGEILNYRELRAELDYPFNTDGDTEVLLAGLSIHGESFVDRLRGQFAFAWFDQVEDRLTLVRDYLGILPLYFATGDDWLVFGSEVKALMPSGLVVPAVDVDSLDAYLAYGTVPAPFTLYRGVRQLPPGHLMRSDRSGTVTLHQYWSAQPSDAEAWTDRSAVAAVDQALTSSVTANLVADVPVGAYLSGGLDSSLIVAVMRDLQPDAVIHTYNASFGDARFDEAVHAERVARDLRTNHAVVPVRPSDFLDLWPTLTWFRDGPLSVPADIAVYRLAQRARQDVRVALSGEGSDELFSGYPKYSTSFLTAVAARYGLSSAAEFAPAVDDALRGVDHRLRLAGRAALAPNTPEGVRSWFAPFTDWERKRLLGGRRQRRPLPAFGSAGAGPARLMAQHDLATWLPDVLLARGDRMSMAASLEVRPPFLDRPLVELALGLPQRFKVRRGTRKWVVKQVAGRHLPDSIVHRPKVGFRVPMDEWFRGSELGDMAGDLLLSPHSLSAVHFDRSVVADMLAEHNREDANHERALWTLLALEVWYQRCILGAGGR